MCNSKSGGNEVGAVAPSVPCFSFHTWVSKGSRGTAHGGMAWEEPWLFVQIAGPKSCTQKEWDRKVNIIRRSLSVTLGGSVHSFLFRYHCFDDYSFVGGFEIRN